MPVEQAVATMAKPATIDANRILEFIGFLFSSWWMDQAPVAWLDAEPAVAAGVDDGRGTIRNDRARRCRGVGDHSVSTPLTSRDWRAPNRSTP